MSPYSTSLTPFPLQVIHKLSVSTPSADLVDGYLQTIAQKYNVEWTPPQRLAVCILFIYYN